MLLFNSHLILNVFQNINTVLRCYSFDMYSKGFEQTFFPVTQI